jgi:LysR family transcriptional regulator, regulator for bpeEF and oprC
MDLNQLSVFVKVVDKGSFTKAAEALRQPKSRVSRNIAALEREFGVPLLYRSTRQFSLTEEGKALYEKTREHIYGLEGASELLQYKSGRVAGVLKLTASEDLGSTLLGPFISELTKQHPELRVHLYLSNEVVDLVKEGIDIAIRIDELGDTSLMAKKIGIISFFLVATPSYLKNSAPIRTIEDLARHPALVFSGSDQQDTWTLVKDKKSKNIRVQALCQSNNPKALLDIALNSHGVALLPEFLCLELILQKKLTRVLPDYSTHPVPVYFVWPPQKGDNPRLRACIDMGTTYLSPYFR